jgi:hypothetical protein
MVLTFNSIKLHFSSVKSYRFVNLGIMSYQLVLLRYLAMVTILVGLPLMPALAQDTGVSGISPDTITLDPIKDIFVNPSGYAKNTQELYTQPDLIQNITRQATWKKQVPLDKIQLPLKVTYELKDNNGTANRLNSSTNGNSAIKVILNPLEIIEISRNQENNLAVIEGKVEFTLDPTQSQIAGVHGGRLSVCIQSKDGECL